MIYEIFAIIYLLFSIIVYFGNPYKEFYRTYGGKRYPKKLSTDEKTKEKQVKFLLGILFWALFAVFGLIITLLFMFWTASKGIIFAKYYAFGLLGYFLLSFIYTKFKKTSKKIPKKRSLWGSLIWHITSLLEIGITVYALWVLI